MFNRLLNLTKTHSFFLFGARNTGKSTLVHERFDENHTLIINLLNFEEEQRFSRAPDELYNVVTALSETITHVLIDEVQKIPKLLDIVHRLLFETNKIFILTGSSARKLKRGGANLLAGRAFVYHLFPLSFLELGETFELTQALSWGTLPEIFQFTNTQDKRKFLLAYTNTYLKEEIASEQLVRGLDPFRRFIEVAAQCNGKIINYLNIARDTGVSDKTVHSYYSILEDTLVGFYLDAYHGSFRKRLKTSPKFYFFDTGVVRALTGLIDADLRPKTNQYGWAFEHYIIIECYRLCHYYKETYKLYYLQTKDDVEIHLVIERPGLPLLLIEIKSTELIDESMLKSFIKLSADIPNSEALCLSNDCYVKKYHHVRALPWQQGLKEIFIGFTHVVS